MGASQSHEIKANVGEEGERLAVGSGATYEQLLSALNNMEKSATVPTVRDSFLTNTPMLDQLIAFVRSKPFPQVLKSGGYDMNNHGHYGVGDTLRAPALKVLISLTSDISQTNLDQNAERILNLNFDNKSKITNPSPIDPRETNDFPATPSMWLACTGGRNDSSSDNFGKPGDANRDTSAAKIRVQDYKRIRRYLCDLIGSRKNLQHFVSLLVSEEEHELSGLAIRLISNISEGGSDRLRCNLATMPLHLLVHFAASQSGALKVEHTAVFRTLANITEHPVYHEDRQRGVDAHSGKKFMTREEISDLTALESMKRPAGSKPDNRSPDIDHDNLAPYTDIFELRVHKRLLDLDIMSAIGIHISCGIPSSTLLIEIIRCIFNLVSGKNLLIMETEAFAERRVHNTRKLLMDCKVPLEYDASVKHSMPMTATLLDATSILDLLLWCINLNNQEPSWTSSLEGVNEKLPYPWNIARASDSCSNIRIHAMEALSALTSSVSNFSPLLRHSIQVPETKNSMIMQPMLRGNSDEHTKYVTGVHSVSSSEASSTDSDTQGSGADDEDIHNTQVNMLNRKKSMNRGLVDSKESNSSATKRKRKNKHSMKARVKRYSTAAISHMLQALNEHMIQGGSDSHVLRLMTQGLKKEWHVKLVEKAVGCFRGTVEDEEEFHNRADLISSIRRLAYKAQIKKAREKKNMRRLRELTFDRVEETYSVRIKRKPSSTGKTCYISMDPVKKQSTSRWVALKHSVRSDSILNSETFTLQGYTDRIFYTVSTSNAPHDLNPLWELYPPAALVEHFGVEAGYSLEFDKTDPRGIGLKFVSQKDPSMGNGVAISEIKDGSQADLGRISGLCIGDLLMSINGTEVCGAKWGTQRVQNALAEAENPVCLTFFGWKARSFLQKLHSRCATRRWFPGCDDSVWTEPGYSTFRAMRVVVKHEKYVEISDIFNGSAMPLDGGCGLLEDSLSSINSAYIVQASQILEQNIHNKCDLHINKGRILNRLHKSALNKVLHLAICDTFTRGFHFDLRRSDLTDFLKSYNGKEARLAVVVHCLYNQNANCRNAKSQELSRYHATSMILKLFLCSLKMKERSQALSLLDILYDALSREEMKDTKPSKIRETVVLKNFKRLFVEAIHHKETHIRRYTTCMHVADLCQNVIVRVIHMSKEPFVDRLTNFVTSIVKQIYRLTARVVTFTKHLALRITRLLIPVITHALENFKDLDQASCRRFLYSVECLSYQSETECAQVLKESGCFRAIMKIAKSYYTHADPKTIQAGLYALAAATVHRDLIGHLKHELGLLSFITKNDLNFQESAGERRRQVRLAVLLARSNLIKPPQKIGDQTDFKNTLDVLIKLVNNIMENSKDDASADVYDEASITFKDDPRVSVPLKHRGKIKRKLAWALNRRELSQWIALGALARLTSHPTRGHQICRELASHSNLIQRVVYVAKTHYSFFGSFGSTLGQIQAVEILFNLCNKPGGLILWLQFSEEHKLAMDHSGSSVPSITEQSLRPPTDQMHPHYLSHGKTICGKCNEPYLNSEDGMVIQTFDYVRPGPWHYVEKFHKRGDSHHEQNKTAFMAYRQKRLSSHSTGAGAIPFDSKLEKRRSRSAWLCPKCYADDLTDRQFGRKFGQTQQGVCGVQPAWIYREEEYDERERIQGLPTRMDIGERVRQLKITKRKLMKAQEMRLQTFEIEDIRADLADLQEAQEKQHEREKCLRSKVNNMPFSVGTFVTVFIPTEDHVFSKIAMYNGQRGIVRSVVYASKANAHRQERFGEEFWYKVAIEQESQSDDQRIRSKLYEVKHSHLLVTSSRLPPIRWGAKLGRKVKIVIPDSELELPTTGWTITVWFRGGSWIRKLSSNLHFLTLCESGDGTKLVALDNDMQLGCFATASEENDNEPTWHCTERSLLILNETMRSALGTDREDFLTDEPGRWYQLVVIAQHSERGNQSLSFWLGVSSKTMSTSYTRFGRVSGFFPYSKDIKFVGNSKDNFQNWGAISDFRVYNHPFDTSDPSSWKGQRIPPVNKTRLQNIVQYSKPAMPNGLQLMVNEADVLQIQHKVVNAGALDCLSAVIQNSSSTRLRKIAIRTVALLASSVSLRASVIGMKCLTDAIYKGCNDPDNQISWWSLRALVALQ